MTTRSLHSFLQHLRRSLHPSHERTLSDAQLLERWTALHDQAMFELLLWRHGPMVQNTCRRILRRDEDIEDVFQATFLVLVRKSGSIRRREALAAWLHRVACRIALRVRTASARRASREQPLGDVLATADTEEVAARDLRAVLDEEIDRLPSHYRRALILCCLEGKSQEEAARLLACPRGTVSSWLTRGRERLRQRLLRRGVDLSIVGLAAALVPDATAGGLAPLIASFLRGATAGGVVPIGMMSVQTIALAEGMLRTMLMTKVKVAAVVLLLGGLFAAGVGTFSHSTQAADPPPEPRQSEKATKDFRLQSQDEKGSWNDWKIGLRMSKNDSIAWGKAAHGLQAGIAFRPGDQESYTIGESVTFVVYLRNVSKTTIRLTHTEPLFAEFMPTVEDGDGKRIGVAAGPANLGTVPIIHRTLEPNERITLGYPWFRIRPTDWQGKILGPTCCALPGRYKVGYVGFPLRLNEDKEDVMSPATGQVELNIRQSDSSGDNRIGARIPRKEGKSLPKPSFISSDFVRKTSTWPAKETPLPQPVFMSKRSFDIPFRVDPTTREQTHEVILYVSKDHGRTVEIADRQLPNAKCFHFRAPSDGMYWLVVRTEKMNRRQRSVDTPIDQPSQRICVDTVRPEAKLQLIRRQDDVISIQWDVDDENLDKQSIQLEYQRIDGEAWTKLPIKPTTEGRYAWSVLDNIEVWVRLRVRDKAGNEAITTLPIPPEKRP